MRLEAPDLLPLWSSPAPIGHNGGPALQSRASGRPSISTSDLRERICDLLCDGVPLAGDMPHAGNAEPVGGPALTSR